MGSRQDLNACLSVCLVIPIKFYFLFAKPACPICNFVATSVWCDAVNRECRESVMWIVAVINCCKKDAGIPFVTACHR